MPPENVATALAGAFGILGYKRQQQVEEHKIVLICCMFVYIHTYVRDIWMS